MDLKVIDNFLPEDVFKKIETNLMGHMIPWYYVSKITDEESKLSSPGYQYQFCHIFFAEHQIMSNFYQLVIPILNKLKAKSLEPVKQ